MKPPRRRAFTLIELLVVISVIALLMSILLPVLGSARASGRAATCMSNMRGLGQATEMYAQDNDATYPRSKLLTKNVTETFTPRNKQRAVWYNALDHYLTRGTNSGLSADRKHDAFKQDPVWQGFSPTDQAENRTIKMNTAIGAVKGETVQSAFTRQAELRRASETVMYVDGRALDAKRNDGTATSPFAGLEFSASEGDVIARHPDQAANVAFGDTHARTVSQDLRYDLIYPTWFLQSDPRQTLLWRF